MVVRRWIIILCELVAWTLPAFADEVVPFVLQDSIYRTNLGISNLDSQAAEVSIYLYDNNGQLAGQGLVQVPGLGFVNLGQVVYFVFGSESELPFAGYLRLQSPKRIVVFASQIQNANNDPGIIPSTTDNLGSLILPMTTSIEPWSSSVAIVNLATHSTVVRVSLRGETGALLAEGERTLASASQWISANIHQELGVQSVRGSLTVRSLDAAPLAVICRHTQTLTRQDVFQQPFDLKNAAKVFYLPYRSVKDLHQSWVVLNNLDPEPAIVTLQPFSPDGVPQDEYSFPLPGLGSALIADSLFLNSQDDRSPYGIIRGTSTRPMSGLVIQTNLATRDTLHTNIATTDSPELLIPSASETATFSSNLLVSNLGESATWVEIVHRRVDGQSPVPPFKTQLPAHGSVYLDKVLAGLGVGTGFGPLALRSTEGQPLLAFSQVTNTENGARGGLDSVDSRPTISKQVGQRLTLRWQYNPAEISTIQGYRIYRADRITRNFQLIASVPVNVLEYSLDATEPGDFTIAVKAFNGVSESNPSNEVLVQVRP